LETPRCRLAIDSAVAEFRHRVAEHVFLNSGQLSPLCHRPLDLHRFMEQFAHLLAQPLDVILVEGDPDRAPRWRASWRTPACSCA